MQEAFKSLFVPDSSSDKDDCAWVETCEDEADFLDEGGDGRGVVGLGGLAG